MELSRDLKPPKPGPRIEFVTPRNTTPISYVVISRRIWAHPVHWTGSRTTPCTLKLGLEGQPVVNCEGCKAKMAVRWKGYLHVVRLGSQGDLFLCLTPNSGDYLLSTYGEITTSAVSQSTFGVPGKRQLPNCSYVSTTGSRESKSHAKSSTQGHTWRQFFAYKAAVVWRANLTYNG